MATASLAHHAHPSTRNELLDATAAIEAEFERLRAARPYLLSRIRRAEDLLVTHQACKKTLRAGIIKPGVRAGELVCYLVAGSGGAVYKVDPVTFACSCPDHHRRDSICKHGIACYALGRAYRPSPATPPVAPVSAIESARSRTVPCVGCDERFRGRDLIEVVGADHLTFFEGDRLCRSCATSHGGVL